MVTQMMRSYHRDYSHTCTRSTAWQGQAFIACIQADLRMSKLCARIWPSFFVNLTRANASRLSPFKMRSATCTLPTNCLLTLPCRLLFFAKLSFLPQCLQSFRCKHPSWLESHLDAGDTNVNCCLAAEQQTKGDQRWNRRETEIAFGCRTEALGLLGRYSSAAECGKAPNPKAEPALPAALDGAAIASRTSN